MESERLKVLSGLEANRSGIGKIVNCMIFSTVRSHGCTVITDNGFKDSRNYVKFAILYLGYILLSCVFLSQNKSSKGPINMSNNIEESNTTYVTVKIVYGRYINELIYQQD
jgi:hypothetical protein